MNNTRVTTPPLADALSAYIAALKSGNVYSSQRNAADVHNIIVSELDHILTTNTLPPGWVDGERPVH